MSSTFRFEEGVMFLHATFSDYFVAPVSSRDDQHSGGPEADGSVCQ